MISLTSVDRKQGFRYMGLHAEPDANMQKTADLCEKRLLAAVRPRYMYQVCPVTFAQEGVLCGGTALVLTGRDIASHLHGCERVILLCATLSAGADTATEAEILAQFPDKHATWRFSPGYGDLPLETQGDFLRTLNAEKRLGVTLSPGGLCIPTKTVTAVIGLSTRPVEKGKRGCAVCNLRATCPYRAKGAHCK